MANFKEICKNFFNEYQATTAKNLKIIDAYLLYILLTGVMQFLYCLIVGTFPFNSFLAGFISSVACFVLGVSLRLQVSPSNKLEFDGISKERAYADFLFAHIILHLVVFNFIG
ncbi:dolichyl-diphosphooligosaccharide--protein glycosyltransferase subunit [Brevipalpus obovatus]|uniref:dolichyl-diphosphooligosaccharide--protein glycosyltransferase subunit n=1 Tax=Brevipalpus obovatus TaxID=246614 RepID=UPI003D9EEB93